MFLRRVSWNNFSHLIDERNLNMRIIVDITKKFFNIKNWIDFFTTIKNVISICESSIITNLFSLFQRAFSVFFKITHIILFHESSLNQNMKFANLLSNENNNFFNIVLFQTFFQCPNLTFLNFMKVFDWFFFDRLFSNFSICQFEMFD